jgi:hypothetical protein
MAFSHHDHDLSTTDADFANEYLCIEKPTQAKKGLVNALG